LGARGSPQKPAGATDVPDDLGAPDNPDDIDNPDALDALDALLSPEGAA